MLNVGFAARVAVAVAALALHAEPAPGEPHKSWARYLPGAGREPGEAAA